MDLASLTVTSRLLVILFIQVILFMNIFDWTEMKTDEDTCMWKISLKVLQQFRKNILFVTREHMNCFQSWIQTVRHIITIFEPSIGVAQFKRLFYLQLPYQIKNSSMDSSHRNLLKIQLCCFFFLSRTMKNEWNLYLSSLWELLNF